MKEGMLSGMEEFSKSFRPKRLLVVGAGGIALTKFLSESITKWID
jgi:hypothetical protein